MTTRISAGCTDVTVQVADLALENIQLKGRVAELEVEVHNKQKALDEKYEKLYQETIQHRQTASELRKAQETLGAVKVLMNEIWEGKTRKYSWFHIAKALSRAVRGTHRFRYWNQPEYLNRNPNCDCEDCQS